MDPNSAQDMNGNEESGELQSSPRRTDMNTSQRSTGTDLTTNESSYVNIPSVRDFEMDDGGGNRSGLAGRSQGSSDAPRATSATGGATRRRGYEPKAPSVPIAVGVPSGSDFNLFNTSADGGDLGAEFIELEERLQEIVIRHADGTRRVQADLNAIQEQMTTFCTHSYQILFVHS